MHGKENVKFISTSTMAGQRNLPWARLLKSKHSCYIYYTRSPLLSC